MHSAQFSTLGVSLIVLSAGCAHSPPARELADAQAAIQAASHYPAGNSSANLDRALRKEALARRWLAAGDHGPARWLAEQAQVDAELAAAQLAAQVARGHAHRTRAALLMPPAPRPPE